jgi:phosphatidylserine decarboxylase
MSHSHPLIAREGWPFVAGTLAAALAGTLLLGAWSVPLWLLFAFALQFFRDPPRSAPAGAGLVLSPADGRVVSVEACRDPFIEREALRISVFMNVFNAHSNRSPVDGQVIKRWYFPGRFFNAELSKSSLENERNVLWLKTPEGFDVTCVQVAGLVARRILCYVDEGARLGRGERYGFIRFGSRLDVYLPCGARPQVSIGDKVYAAKSVIARLPAAPGGSAVVGDFG